MSSGPPYPFWSLKAMHLMRPPNTMLIVRIRLDGGGHADGRVIDVGNGVITVRSDTGMIMEDVRPEWVVAAKLTKV